MGQDSTMQAQWAVDMLDVFVEQRVNTLPYVPDKALTPLLDGARRHDTLTTIPLTREEEGVGILAGVDLAGQRGALVMQASGAGNCLNAIGSLTIAQRFPLLAIISQRGGLNETVSTQIPFGYALPRILEAMGVQCHLLDEARRSRHVTRAAVETAFVSRAPVVILLTAELFSEGRP